MGEAKIIIWDVNHGNAIYIRTPNMKDVMIDCGSNDSTNFSPSKYVKEKKRLIDFLIISHPHYDHISDIENFIECHKPKILLRPRLSLKRILDANQGWAEKTIKKYYEFQKPYDQPALDENNPTKPEWGDTLHFTNFTLSEDDSSLNNMGVVTFVKYGAFTLLCPGDVEERGWKRLLEMDDFITQLEKTNFLVASHHGRKNGYYNEIFDYFTPYLTFISDGRFGDTSATGRYSEISTGWKVKKRSTNEYVKRYTLTTRNDGAISINIVDGKNVEVTID